jgi:hypothetical protein
VRVSALYLIQLPPAHSCHPQTAGCDRSPLGCCAQRTPRASRRPRVPVGQPARSTPRLPPRRPVCGCLCAHTHSACPSCTSEQPRWVCGCAHAPWRSRSLGGWSDPRPFFCCCELFVRPGSCCCALHSPRPPTCSSWLGFPGLTAAAVKGGSRAAASPMLPMLLIARTNTSQHNHLESHTPTRGLLSPPLPRPLARLGPPSLGSQSSFFACKIAGRSSPPTHNTTTHSDHPHTQSIQRAFVAATTVHLHVAPQAQSLPPASTA